MPPWLAGCGCITGSKEFRQDPRWPLPILPGPLCPSNPRLWCGLLHLYFPTGTVPIPPKQWARLVTSREALISWLWEAVLPPSSNAECLYQCGNPLHFPPAHLLGGPSSDLSPAGVDGKVKDGEGKQPRVEKGFRAGLTERAKLRKETRGRKDPEAQGSQASSTPSLGKTRQRRHTGSVSTSHCFLVPVLSS